MSKVDGDLKFGTLRPRDFRLLNEGVEPDMCNAWYNAKGSLSMTQKELERFEEEIARSCLDSEEFRRSIQEKIDGLQDVCTVMSLSIDHGSPFREFWNVRVKILEDETRLLSERLHKDKKVVMFPTWNAKPMFPAPSAMKTDPLLIGSILLTLVLAAMVCRDFCSYCC